MEESGKNQYAKIVLDIELMLTGLAQKFLESVEKELEENEISKPVRMKVVAEMNNQQNRVLTDTFSVFEGVVRKKIFNSLGATEKISNKKTAESSMDDLLKMSEEAERLRARIHYCMRCVELGKLELESLGGYFEILNQIELKNEAENKLKRLLMQ